MLHALALGTGVVRAVALQQIDNAPHAQASAQGHNEGLQGGDSGRKELHINLHILREYHPGHEKSRQLRRQGHPLATLTRSYTKVSGSSRSS